MSVPGGVRDFVRIDSTPAVVPRMVPPTHHNHPLSSWRRAENRLLQLLTLTPQSFGSIIPLPSMSHSFELPHDLLFFLIAGRSSPWRYGVLRFSRCYLLATFPERPRTDFDRFAASRVRSDGVGTLCALFGCRNSSLATFPHGLCHFDALSYSPRPDRHTR